MIKSNLYKSVLLDPASDGANELFIVSGYASATFTRRHIDDLLKVSGESKVNLIIGMPSKKSDHQAFVDLINHHPLDFFGHYYQGSPSVHSKMYSWFKDDTPNNAFSGSANYSQYGFFEKNQINQITKDDPVEIKDFYLELLESAVPILDFETKELPEYRPSKITGSLAPGQIEWLVEDVEVRISFLTADGKLPEKSGLNWGQRLDNLGNQREPNQAYLSIRREARKEGFLPEKGFTFSMITDDGEVFDCTVQQEGRKAVATTYDNSILGRYLRKRLKVKNGDLVTPEDLERYGRSDFTLKKMDNETFFFDFSVQSD